MRTNTPSETACAARELPSVAAWASAGRLQVASNAPLPSVVTCRNSLRDCRMALLEHHSALVGRRSGAGARRHDDLRSGLERLQQLRLALRRQTRAQLLLLLGTGLLPGQRIADRDVERTELEALGHRARRTDLRDSRLVTLRR